MYMFKSETKLVLFFFFRNQIKRSACEKIQTNNTNSFITNPSKSKPGYLSRCLSTSRFKPKNSKEKLTYNDIPKIK